MSEPSVCRACRQPLTSIRNTEQETGEKWVHVTLTDHPADPIPRREFLTLTLICDFCSSPHIVSEGVVFEADPYQLETAGRLPQPHEPGNEMGDYLGDATHITWQDDGLGWGACPRCAPLIRAHKWEHLRARCANVLQTQNPQRDPRVLELTVATAHETFQHTWTGREHAAGLIEPPPE